MALMGPEVLPQYSQVNNPSNNKIKYLILFHPNFDTGSSYVFKLNLCATQNLLYGGRKGLLRHVKPHFSECGKSPWKVATLSAHSPGYQTGSYFQQLQSTQCQMECPTSPEICLWRTAAKRSQDQDLPPPLSKIRRAFFPCCSLCSFLLHLLRSWNITGLVLLQQQKHG